MYPVIAIDGPSASGKGTVAARVAAALGFAYLDSGALYRVTAYAAEQAQVDSTNEAALAHIASTLNVHFVGGDIELDGVNVTADIRSERMGLMASKVAALPLVRRALLQRQRDFLTPQGLVADGRDMGSVVFPNAALKVFLTASAESRTERRFKQLKEKGDSVIFADVLLNMEQRDTQDKARSMAPLRQFDDAFLLDTSHLSIEQAVEQVISWFRQIG